MLRMSWRRYFRCVAVCGLALAALSPVNSQEGSPLPFALPEAGIAVLFFLASDCPISNRLIPEMMRIDGAFRGRGVRFLFVYPNVTESAAAVQAHQSAFRIGGPVSQDPGQRLRRLTGAQVTPEAAIVVRRGGTLETVYLGRIDDRFLRLGTERPHATRHDLEESLEAVLSGRAVPPPGGPPVGCAIIARR